MASMTGSTMRIVLLPLCLAAGLAACDGENSVRITTTASSDGADKGVLRVVDTLQCPDTQGVLTRKGLAPNGAVSCVYGGPKGAEVVLHLVKLDGRTAAEALQDFERQMTASLPEAGARFGAEAARADRQAAAADQDAADADAQAAANDAQDSAQDEASVRAPGVDIRAKGDDASVRLPGLRIETRGDNASVRIGGINIQSRDGSGTRTETSNVSVDTSGHSTRVRTIAPGAATRMTFFIADDQPSASGWRRVGFEARGPEGGPIVVATIRSKDRRNDDVFDAAKALVTLNVGQ